MPNTIDATAKPLGDAWAPGVAGSGGGGTHAAPSQYHERAPTPVGSGYQPAGAPLIAMGPSSGVVADDANDEGNREDQDASGNDPSPSRPVHDAAASQRCHDR